MLTTQTYMTYASAKRAAEVRAIETALARKCRRKVVAEILKGFETDAQSNQTVGYAVRQAILWVVAGV
jgi:hypothetical protein